MNYWLKIGAAVAGVWLVAAGTIYWARHAKPTADSVAAYLHERDVAATSGTQRARLIDSVASRLNSLPFEQRQELQRRGETRRFFAALTPAEQGAFLDATLPAGFKQLMESFNKMDPARRKKMVDGALEEMRKHEGDGPPPNFDDKLAQKVTEQGLKSFYQDANADVKMDLAPLIEQMQRNLHGGAGQ